MKPIKLKMQAFGSYVNPVELDFERGLHGEKFFLIHGATGAGKTSILDAICYALYNESSGGDRKKSDLCSELVPFDKITELEFTFSLGEKIYRVHRNFKRKSDKDKIKIESTAELFEDEIFKCGKVTEVNEYLKNRLGFSVEQFRQVVILPQNQFANFLKADNDKRAKILNVIFNAELYEKIEQGLKEKFDSAKILQENLLERQKNFFAEAKSIGNFQAEVDEKSLSDLIAELEKHFIESEEKLSEFKLKSDAAQKNLTDGKILSDKFLMAETSEKNFQRESEILKEVEKNFNLAKVEYEKRKDEESQRKDLENKIADLKKNQQAIEEFQNKNLQLAREENKETFAKKNIEKLNDEQKKYENFLEELKAQFEKLKDAKVKFAEIKNILEKSQERADKSEILKDLQKELSAREKVFVTIDKNYLQAKKDFERYRYLQLTGAGVKLAETLEEGKPCPVCGATHHPAPALSKEFVPSDADVEKRENLFNQRRDRREKELQEISMLKGEIKKLTEELKKFADALPLDEVTKKFAAAEKDVNDFEKISKRIDKGEKCVAEKKAEIDSAKKLYDEVSKKVENLRGAVEEKQNQIPAKYLENPKKISDDLSENLQAKKILDEAWTKADRNFHELDRLKSNQEGKVKAAELAKIDAAKKIEGKIKPNIEALEESARETKFAHEKFIAENKALEKDLFRIKEISAKLAELDKKIKTAQKNYDIWEKLSSVASGKGNSKVSFTRYYLNVMFQNVIYEANERLYKMSGGQYSFQDMGDKLKGQKKKAGLDLEIVDINTGRARPVETLSGGESFLASLSLALGLAAVVKNNAGGIKLDTIFIDEGFGSLDSETLDFAVNALTDLQKDGGRLVGIISHVEELKQRIPTRLEVTKNKFGSAAKFI